jgi:hypothetical protein
LGQDQEAVFQRLNGCVQPHAKRSGACRLQHPLPGGYSPTGETGWRVAIGVVSYHLVDLNKKTETTIDGNGLSPLTSRCNMVPAFV